MTVELYGGTAIQIWYTKRQSIISLALSAVKNLLPTEIRTENTALMPVIFQIDLEVITVTDEQFEQEKQYQASMNFFQSMLKSGVITEEQYAIIDTKMLEKYKPLLGTLFAQNRLLL